MSHPARTLIVVTSVAFGVAVPVAMWLATDAAVSGLRNDLRYIAGKADLQIMFGTGEARLSESVVDTVRAQPFVAAAAAVLRGSLSFTAEPRDTIEVFGVDLLQKDIRTLHDVEVIDRRLDDLSVASNPHVIFLSESIAEERRLAVGDEVELTGPKGTSSYTVQGILRTHGFARVYGGRSAVMYLPSAQLAFTDVTDPLQSVVHQIDVALTPGTSVEDAKLALGRVLPHELTIGEPIQRGIELERNVDGLRATLTGVASLALLAAMFIVYSANVALIAYRASTFSTLRSLGVGGGPLRRLVLLEAFATGAVGGAIGVPLGFGMARLALGDVVTGMELNYAVRAAPSTLLANVGPQLLVFVLLGGATSFMAAFLPSRRILLSDEQSNAPQSAIADEGSRTARSWLVAFGLVVIALGAASLFFGVTSRELWACALGGTVTVIGVVLSSLQLVEQIWQRYVRAAVARHGAIGWLSAENLVRDTERGLVAVAAIALCGAVAIAAATLPTSFRSSATHWYGFRGDATVASRTSGKGWLPAGLLPPYVARITTLPSVARAETLRVVHGQVFQGGRIAVVGLSERYLGEVASVATGTCPESVAALAKGDAAIVSENFVRRFAVRSGTTLVVDSPTGQLSLFVCGATPDFTSDQGSIIVSAELLSRRWLDDLTNYVSVDLKAGADATLLRRELVDNLGAAHGLIVYDTGELRHVIEQVLADAFRDVDAIQLLVFFITFAGIIDLVASTVIDRRREFVLLRAVGARDRSIAQSVAVEAGILGLTAGVIAIVTGALFAYLWLAFIYPVLVGYVLRHHFAWTAACVVLVVAGITAVAAGYAAARISLRSLAADVPRAH